MIPKVAIRLASPGTVGSEADPSHPFLVQCATSSRLHTSTTMPHRAGVTWRLHHLSRLSMLIFEGSSKKSDPCFKHLEWVSSILYPGQVNGLEVVHHILVTLNEK